MATSAMPESSATIRRRLDDSDLAEDELRRAPRTGASRVALVLAGKIGSLTQRTLYHFVKAAPSVVALGALTWSEHVINPLKSRGIEVDVFGHAWSPEAEPFVREFWRPTASSPSPTAAASSRTCRAGCSARICSRTRIRAGGRCRSCWARRARCGSRRRTSSATASRTRRWSSRAGTSSGCRRRSPSCWRRGWRRARSTASGCPTCACRGAARVAEPRARRSNFKYEACGGGKPQPSLVPPPAARCGASSRQCYADQQPARAASSSWTGGSSGRQI